MSLSGSSANAWCYPLNLATSFLESDGDDHAFDSIMPPIRVWLDEAANLTYTYYKV